MLDQADPPKARVARRGVRREPTWLDYLADPRTAVLSFLAGALLIGGGRRILQGIRTRRLITALAEPSPPIETIEAAADHGRAGLIDLFRLLGTAEGADARAVAGRALATLWARDELIPEEEKAIVLRGFTVDWHARRRYPRGLSRAIPIRVDFGVPFLVEDGPGVCPDNLEWSSRVAGAQRASLEQFSAWEPGAGAARFDLDPGDFPSNGPHRLVFQSRVRAVGLTDAWEVELPQIPFSFEFDPHLGIDALLALPDETRARSFQQALRLEPPEGLENGSRFLELGPDLVLRDPPDLVVATPLPCDLAHAVAIEFDGVTGLFPAGEVVLAGQGIANTEAKSQRFPLARLAGWPSDAITRPGEVRLRAHLTADPHLGWADPEIRSIWPGSLTTDWAIGRIIRR
jgi:hypothetical protein